MDLSKIYEGWKNNYFPPEHLKEVIKNAQTHRLEVCSTCPENSVNKKEATLRWDDHCTNCGCTLSAKTACLTCSCPLDKWVEILTEEQHEEILNNNSYEK